MVVMGVLVLTPFTSPFSMGCERRPRNPFLQFTGNGPEDCLGLEMEETDKPEGNALRAVGWVWVSVGAWIAA
jgi:hypothetical protein